MDWVLSEMCWGASFNVILTETSQARCCHLAYFMGKRMNCLRLLNILQSRDLNPGNWTQSLNGWSSSYISTWGNTLADTHLKHPNNTQYTHIHVHQIFGSMHLMLCGYHVASETPDFQPWVDVTSLFLLETLTGERQGGGERGNSLIIPKLLNCPAQQRLCNMFELCKLHQASIISTHWGQGAHTSLKFLHQLFQFLLHPAFPRALNN